MQVTEPTMKEKYNDLGLKLWKKAHKTGEDGLRFLLETQLAKLTPDERYLVKHEHISFATCDYGVDSIPYFGRYFIVRK